MHNVPGANTVEQPRCDVGEAPLAIASGDNDAVVLAAAAWGHSMSVNYTHVTIAIPADEKCIRDENVYDALGSEKTAFGIDSEIVVQRAAQFLLRDRKRDVARAAN